MEKVARGRDAMRRHLPGLQPPEPQSYSKGVRLRYQLGYPVPAAAPNARGDSRALLALPTSKVTSPLIALADAGGNRVARLHQVSGGVDSGAGGPSAAAGGYLSPRTRRRMSSALRFSASASAFLPAVFITAARSSKPTAVAG